MIYHILVGSYMHLVHEICEKIDIDAVNLFKVRNLSYKPPGTQQSILNEVNLSLREKRYSFSLRKDFYFKLNAYHDVDVGTLLLSCFSCGSNDRKIILAKLSLCYLKEP